MPRRRCFLTLQQAIDEVDAYGGDEQGGMIEHTQMVLLPPEQVDGLSDEERIDEDNLEAATPGDIAGQIEVEAFDESEDDDDDDVPLARFTKDGQWKKTENFDKVLNKRSPEPLIETHPELVNLSPVELFFKFCDSSVLELLIKESSRYAETKNKHDFQVDESDLYAFFGILLLSGYHTLPSERLYWSKDEDVAVPLVGCS